MIKQDFYYGFDGKKYKLLDGFLPSVELYDEEESKKDE